MKQKTVISYLQEKPAARERRNQHKAVSGLLRRKYKELGDLPIQQLENIVFDAVTANRLWRDVLKKNPELRGTDYEKGKKQLEKRAQASLGYINQV